MATDRYLVVSWDDSREVLGRHESLNVAKRQCRGLGHTDEYNAYTDRYAPVAFVGEYRDCFGEMVLCCVYNPRFYRYAYVDPQRVSREKPSD